MCCCLLLKALVLLVALHSTAADAIKHKVIHYYRCNSSNGTSADCSPCKLAVLARLLQPLLRLTAFALAAGYWQTGLASLTAGRRAVGEATERSVIEADLPLDHAVVKVRQDRKLRDALRR